MEWNTVPVYSTPPPFMGVVGARLASEGLMCALARGVEELLIEDAVEVVQPQLTMDNHAFPHAVDFVRDVDLRPVNEFCVKHYSVSRSSVSTSG